MRRMELGCGCGPIMSACGRFGHEVVNSSKMSPSPCVAVGLEAGAGHPVLSPHVDLLQHVVGLEPSPSTEAPGSPQPLYKMSKTFGKMFDGRKAATPWDHM